jgi:hypothetical protein
MQVKAEIVINRFDIDTQGRYPIRVDAAFKIGNMPNGMNPFKCTIEPSKEAIELIEKLKIELAKGVGERIQEESTND